jgi:tetratricopeptide (TPR) repeat protein
VRLSSCVVQQFTQPLRLLLCLWAAGGALGQTTPIVRPGARAVFNEGVEALRSGQFAKAEENFRRVIKLDPASTAAHIDLGVAYMRERRWSDALGELRRAEQMSPQEPGIKLNVGLAYYRQNQFSSAIEPLSAAVHLAPNSVQARYLLGLCYFFQRSYAPAVSTLQPLWESESSNLNYLYVLSVAAHKSTNALFEQRAFDQMLAVGQNTAEFHLFAGKALLAEGSPYQAAQEFKASIAAQPNLPMAHYFLGRTYLERREYPLAEAEFKKDVVLEPDLPYNYEDLARLYAETNQISKSELNYRQALTLDETLADSYVGLAKLYRDSGRWADALRMLDSAVDLAPDSSSVHYLRATVLTHLGDKAGAGREFTETAQLNAKSHQQQQPYRGDEVADAQKAAPE